MSGAMSDDMRTGIPAAKHDPGTGPTRDPTSARFDAEREPGSPAAPQPTEPEVGGPKGPEPTRYGDWTVKGRCIDF